ncbi:MAG TPA: phosphoribosyltransferase family protein [Solirubrobacteraceae bacterium]|jgi:predicted phosphoribosyltransferase|nr:phosphoribosyltransferase family protein [Solirubrobacteraceae bacterium]
MVFEERRDAGRHLADSLLAHADPGTLVLALPRGGVPVAYEVARALGAPLDVLGARKLGAPGNRELAVGAIAEGGVAVLDEHTMRRCGMTQESLDEVLRRERAELARQVALYRSARPAQRLAGASVIVVDDGLATGLTALAAVRAVREGEAASVVVAVPVGAAEALTMLGREADEVICQMTPRRLRAVGLFYRDFSPVSDETVQALLGESTTELRMAG